MFIVLEGADGCGKTTLCAILAERLKAVAYSTPPKKYLQARDVVDKSASPEEHYRFYRDGIYDASEEITSLLKGGNRVISDRYWLTTYTYHRVMGVGVSKDDFASIVQPTLTVILSLNYETQIEGITRRGVSAGDRRVMDRQREITNAFYQNVLELNIPFVVVSTQYFSPDECADIVATIFDK